MLTVVFDFLVRCIEALMVVFLLGCGAWWAAGRVFIYTFAIQLVGPGVIARRLRGGGPSPRQLAAIVKALERSGWSPRGAEECALFHIGRCDWDKLRPLGVDALPALLAFAARASDSPSRSSAICALASIGEPAVPELIPKLASRNRRSEHWAADAILQIGSVAVDYLAAELALKRGGDDVVVRLLGSLRDPRAVPALLGSLSKHGTVGIIGEIGDPAALPALFRDRRKYHNHYDSSYWFADAVRAAKEIGGPRAIATLRTHLLRMIVPSKEAKIIAKSLSDIGWMPDGVQEQTIALVAAGRWNDIDALGLAAVPTLLEMLQHGDDVQVTSAIARASPALPILLEALSLLESATAKVPIIQGIRQCCDKRAIPALINELCSWQWRSQYGPRAFLDEVTLALNDVADSHLISLLKHLARRMPRTLQITESDGDQATHYVYITNPAWEAVNNILSTHITDESRVH